MVCYCLAFCLYNLICFVQGIPGDEGPCGEPGMTGDPVSESKYKKISICGHNVGSTWSQRTERKYQGTLEGMLV